MYKLIALVGKAGSGKDSIMRGVLNRLPHLNEVISCTTRPIREGERDGVNYFYLTTEDFHNKIINHEMVEYTNFNGWLYGTSTD